MNEELRLHIKKLQNRAILSLIAILLTTISIVWGILLLFVPSSIAMVFFVIAILCIAYLVYENRTTKKESEETLFKPVVFDADKHFSFEEIVTIFENLTDTNNQLSTSDDVRFFRLNNNFKIRTVLYRTTEFNKKRV